MRRLILLLVLSLLAPGAAAVSKFKVLPASGPYYLDGAIEIIFERAKSDRPFLRAPGPESATNFTISLDTYYAGGREFGRLVLQPIAAGPASFGPSAIFTDMGGDAVAELPRLDFLIEPPLDTGEAPLERVFSDQRLHGQLPVAIRAEVEGDAMLGRAMLIRWYLYSERGFGDVRVPPFEIAGTRPRVDFYFTGSTDAGFSAVGGTLVRKRLISQYVAMPEAATRLEMAPVYAEIQLLPDTVRETGLTRTRRIMVLPPITVAPRPTGVPPSMPIGTFEIECPKNFGRVSEYRVSTSVTIKGDATILGSRLRFEGEAPTPVFVAGPYSYQPSFPEGKLKIGGTFDLFTGPVEKGLREVPFPGIAFDYYDLVAKTKRTLHCEATTLVMPRSSFPSDASDDRDRPPIPPRRPAAPKKTNTAFHVAEALAAIFAAGAAVALAITIGRR